VTSTARVSADCEGLPALSCICCGNALENFDPGSRNQPYGGTAFTTHGHYGSTVFDPLPPLRGHGQMLEINVCDNCLTAAAKLGRVAHLTYAPPKEPGVTVVPWSGP
jgi:hypothetical protein